MPVAQGQHAVRTAGDQPHVVRRHQYRDPHAVKFLKQTQDPFREGIVQVTGRFIRQQNGRLVHYRAGDTHALLLTAGELDREVLRFVQQPDLIQRRRNATADIIVTGASNNQRDRDVIENRAIHQQVVILENHANLTTQERHFTVLKTANFMAAEPDFPGAWPLDPTDQLEQGTFPRAGMAGQECHLAWLEVECHPL